MSSDDREPVEQPVEQPAGKSRRSDRWILGLAGAVSLYVLLEANFSYLTPLKQLAVFGSFGIVLCILMYPLRSGVFSRNSPVNLGKVVDGLCIALAIGCCFYLLAYGSELGRRAGLYTTVDLIVGAIGVVLVLEATRRSIGWALPILSIIFILYAHQSVAQQLPDWLFPHRGQDFSSLIGQTYLRTEGVFGTALSVMFKYVFLFVLFGAFLEASGATGYVIGIANRFFGSRQGGPAKVAVLASGLMGSLSGSAVANAATTGTFTIPLMKSIGFRPHIAAGIEAAASSGGALVPPVMGAGAYMMLEIINRNPPVTYLEVCQAAIIPSALYYLSIFLLVHFYAHRLAVSGETGLPRGESTAQGIPESSQAATAAELRRVERPRAEDLPLSGEDYSHARIFRWEGLIFLAAIVSLTLFMLTGSSPFRAVTYSTELVMALILLNPKSPIPLASRAVGFGIWGLTTAAILWLAPRINPWFAELNLGFALPNEWYDALIFGTSITLIAGLLAAVTRKMILTAARTCGVGGVPLIIAAACVGIIIGLVSRTGIGTGIPAAIIPLAGSNLFLALLAIMGCSIVLGMGLPSAVSYLLLATVIGPVFVDPSVGVPILAAHMFIFYFGMMAMVTPPVALAAYATASIAGAGVMQTGFAAFRFSLVGFTLPFMFVYRPELCLMSTDGGSVSILSVFLAVVAAVVGITSLAAAMAGFLFHPLNPLQRAILFVAAACALYPDQAKYGYLPFSLVDLAGAILLAAIAFWSWTGRANRTFYGGTTKG